MPRVVKAGGLGRETSSMNDRVFLDTNVLVYAMDRSDPTKRKRALEVIESDYPDPMPVISTQVLQEFYVTLVRKLKKPLSEHDAERACIQLSQFPMVVIEPQMLLDSIKISRRHSLSLWDALIICAAQKANGRSCFGTDFGTSSESICQYLLNSSSKPIKTD